MWSPLTQEFIVDIVKPWVELNIELSKPSALGSINSLQSKANNLSVALTHFGEKFSPKINRPGILRDMADTFKHTKLRNNTRQTRLMSFSLIECRVVNDQEDFRFLRNQIDIQRDGQSWDFMEESLKEIDFWINSGDLDVFLTESLVILNNSEWSTFQSVIRLFKDNNTPQLVSFGFRTVKENSFGELEPYDAKEVSLECW
jgi:hypothetical protein